jgi:hypothetical protein
VPDSETVSVWVTFRLCHAHGHWFTALTPSTSRPTVGHGNASDCTGSVMASVTAAGIANAHVVTAAVTATVMVTHAWRRNGLGQVGRRIFGEGDHQIEKAFDVFLHPLDFVLC